MRIERYTPHWHSKLVDLAKDVFGEGYFDRPWEAISEADSVMLVSHETDGSLLGFVQGRLLPLGALDAFLENPEFDIPDDVAAADATGTLGVIHVVAVSNEQRGKGLGTKLLGAIHDALIGRGADKLIVTFKRGPSASQVDGLMKKLGFEQWVRLPTYWREACDRGEFKCVDRRDDCTCEALFYRKSVY